MSKLTDDQYGLIERFFNNELRQKDLAKFDSMMQQPAFREVVKLQRHLKHGLEKHQTETPLMQLFEEEAKKYEDSTKATTITIQSTPKENTFLDWLQSLLQPKPVFAYSFLFLLVFAFSSTWWANTTHSNQSIVETLYEPILNDKLAGVSTNKEVLDEGKTAFFKENYQKAEPLFLAIRQESEYYYEAQSLLAYTYFQTNRFDKAIKQFDILLNNYYPNLPNHYRNENKLRWTRLLAYVGSERTSTTIFQEELDYFLKNDSDIYRKKAQNLHAKLNSWWREFVF